MKQGPVPPAPPISMPMPGAYSKIHGKQLIGLVVLCRAGVQNSFRPRGHRRHTMMPRRSDKLTESKRVPWLDDRRRTLEQI